MLPLLIIESHAFLIESKADSRLMKIACARARSEPASLTEPGTSRNKIVSSNFSYSAYFRRMPRAYACCAESGVACKVVVASTRRNGISCSKRCKTCNGASVPATRGAPKVRRGARGAHVS